MIWDNFGLQQNDKDLKTFQLYSYAMDQLDMHSGVITSLHRKMAGSSIITARSTPFSMIFSHGESYCYGGVKPYVATEMQMGIDPITIRSIRTAGESLYIIGDNFTSSSKIFINGNQV